MHVHAPRRLLTWCVGCTYREWALLVPAWSVMTVILTYIAYSALAIRATPAFDEMRAVTGAQAAFSRGRARLIMCSLRTADDRVSLPPAGGEDPYIASARADAIPELYDIPIGMVNSVLYHEAIRRARATARAKARREAAERRPGQDRARLGARP